MGEVPLLIDLTLCISLSLMFAGLTVGVVNVADFSVRFPLKVMLSFCRG